MKETVVGRVLCAAAGVLLLAACGPGLVGEGTVQPAALPTATAPVAAPTAPAAQRNLGFGRGVVPQSGDGSLQGVWSQLPRSPLSDRFTANVVWTGRWLFVWGGEAGDHGAVQRSDGAVWDRTTGRWEPLPPAPLTGRSQAAVVWTGRQVIVWGGYDESDANGFHVTADGAAWDPATNTWTKLPAAPLRARAGTIALWTGTRMVLLGGHPALQTDDDYSYADGATYDPATRAWRMLPVAQSPAGHRIEWRSAVVTDHGLLAWSIWSVTTRVPNPEGSPAGDTTTETNAGGEMYGYDPTIDRWALVPPAPDAMPVDEAIWTGTEVIARGDGFVCGLCGGGFRPETTRAYAPDSNTWTDLPADPLGADHQVSDWAGGLFSFNPGGQYGPIKPGDASAWNPTTNTWTRLPSAPDGCGAIPAESQRPTFLGGRIAYWCPHGKSGSAAAHEGLMYTLTPTTAPAPTP
jgi:hypothetical protein